MNLFGNSNYCNNISLFGKVSDVIAGNSIVSKDGQKELNGLKGYLNDTFIQPMLIRDFDYIKNNKYNFTYLNSQLMKYKNLDENEVNLYLEIVRFAQECIVILEKNEELEDKLYNNDGFMGIVTHVPSIILKPEFEIYKSFFGMPPAGKFDIEAVRTIKNLLDINAGATYSVIEEKLLEIYQTPEFRELAGFRWAEPCRIQKPPQKNMFFEDETHE